MGAIFDAARAEAAGGADKLAALAPEAMQEAIRYASVESFQAVAFIPLLLLPVFGCIWLFDHKRGGHQAQVIGERGAPVAAKQL
jgi:hypothetical protein